MSMFTRKQLFGTALVACCLLSGVKDLPAQKGKGQIHVLFIGNSFTGTMPKTLAELAKGEARPLDCRWSTGPAFSLEKHWMKGATLKKLRSRKWDFVVLQDQSNAPLKHHESMFSYAKNFDTEIKKSGAETVLYMTWADADSSGAARGAAGPDDQRAISKAYGDLARNLNCRLAPVGDAWAAALKADKQLVLHADDKHHANAVGTYLTACVFYATIYKKSPEGLPAAGLTDATARRLQMTAWNTVQATKK